MRFDTSHRQAAQLQKTRTRLFRLTLALAVAMVLIHVATHPQQLARWMGLLAGRAVQPLGPGAGPNAGPGAARLVEPRIDEPLPPGVVRVVPMQTAGPDANDSSAPEGTTPAERRLDAFRRDLLATIDDSIIGISSHEREAYFAMLDRARSTPLEDLERAARRDVHFAELYNAPEDHRGQLITIEGELHRFNPLPPSPDEDHPETLYEGWMFTESGGNANPYRIICATAPTGMPTGESVRERVRFTGFFFKRCGYVTAHGPHFAPLLLGQRPRWLPRIAPVARGPVAPVWPLVLIGLLGIGLVAATWWQAMLSRRAPVHTPAGPNAPPEFDNLSELQWTDANDVLAGWSSPPAPDGTAPPANPAVPASPTIVAVTASPSQSVPGDAASEVGHDGGERSHPPLDPVTSPASPASTESAPRASVPVSPVPMQQKER